MTIVPASDEWLDEQEQNMLEEPTARIPRPVKRRRRKPVKYPYGHNFVDPSCSDGQPKASTMKELKEGGFTKMPWEV